MEMSALGGSERKLSLPRLQNGTKAAVRMLPAMRSGRSEKKMVTGLTPCRVNLLCARSNDMPLAAWTKRKSARLGGSCPACASADPTAGGETANPGAAANRTLLVVMEASIAGMSVGHAGYSTPAARAQGTAGRGG